MGQRGPHADPRRLRRATGVIVLHEAFGVLGPGSAPPALDPRAIFPVGSVSKPITATLIMQLVEDGLLGLNRPAKGYLPELSGDGTDDILVHHLLTHTSGYQWQDDPPMIQHAKKKLSAGFKPSPCPEGQHPLIHELLSLYWDAPRAAAAGEVMIYSNHNYELLGEIVRRLSGCGVEQVARRRILDPLRMHDTFFVVPESESPRVVQRAAGLPFADRTTRFAEGYGSRQWQVTPYAGGGLHTTPLDMTIFAQAILNGGRYGDTRLLSPAAVAAMTRDQIPGIGARFFNKTMRHASWGYGWQIESPTKWPYFSGSLQPLGTFAHPGAGGSTFWIDRAHELVGAYFEVTTKVTANMDHLWNFDLFQNAITAAVED
jgi:serine-type D-Ala-D-Ala carboxypeptidase